MMDELNALNAPKKVVDGLVEVFDGLAQMFAGVSEQLDMLAAKVWILSSGMKNMLVTAKCKKRLPSIS